MAQPNTPLRFKHIAPIAKAIQQAITGDIRLERMNGEYVNIKTWFKASNDGLMYQVEVPKFGYSKLTDCIKAGANAGLTCTPSTATVTGASDYTNINAFSCPRVNAYIDEDGVPHVTAMEGDSNFSLTDNVNGDVWVMTPVLYWSIKDDGKYSIITISDTHHDGLEPQPGALYPDGTERPFMLYAAYAGVKDASGHLASISGRPLFNRTYSHDSSHTLAAERGAGYSGKTRADDWYHKVMVLMKYANKSSQNIMSGCSSYYLTYSVTMAETNTKRVIISTTDANNLLVGSSVMVGNADHTNEVVTDAKILSKEKYDVSNTALVLDVDSTFTTTTTLKVSTAPYSSGYCDSVLGTDGSPISYTSGKEPFKLQNIEMMVGAYEILSDVIMNATLDTNGNPVEEVYFCPDSSKYASSLTSAYIYTGYSLPVGAQDGWYYAEDFVNSHGLLIPQGVAASATTGLGDGVYQNIRSSKGLREWLGVGGLNYGLSAGLFCVSGLAALTYTWWNLAGRLSALGRSAA